MPSYIIIICMVLYTIVYILHGLYVMVWREWFRTSSVCIIYIHGSVYNSIHNTILIHGYMVLYSMVWMFFIIIRIYVRTPYQVVYMSLYTIVSIHCSVHHNVHGSVYHNYVYMVSYTIAFMVLHTITHPVYMVSYTRYHCIPNTWVCIPSFVTLPHLLIVTAVVPSVPSDFPAP